MNEELLIKHDFKLNKTKSKPDCKIYTKDKFDIAIKTDGTCFYTNGGIDYPLSNETELLKMYSELRTDII